MTEELLHLSDRQVLRVVRETPDELELEATWDPGGPPPPSHLHPAQDEHFEIRSGRLFAVVDGVEHALGAGDTIDIPRGTPHNMWNGSGERAVALWVTRPVDGAGVPGTFSSSPGQVPPASGNLRVTPFAVGPGSLSNVAAETHTVTLALAAGRVGRCAPGLTGPGCASPARAPGWRSCGTGAPRRRSGRLRARPRSDAAPPRRSPAGGAP
jgi:mannose-6-phosphate isomerase-like protein (cupin superfamily)